MSDRTNDFDQLATQEYLRLKQFVERFEDAWHQGPRPTLEKFLPALPGERRPVLIELVHAELELRLKAGEAARVENYLERFPDLAGNSAVVLSLIAAEYEQRRRREKGLGPDEFFGRFPQYQAELEARLPPAPRSSDQTTPHLPGCPRPGPAFPLVPGYDILAEVGRGGMGVVYQARQLKLNRRVALKMILAGSQARPAELARFRAEAEAVARLQHPNIVQIYEIGEHNGLPFFSLELVEGGCLADQLDGTPLPARQAAQLVQTLARAVHAAHQHGIVHRDLKPANVLLVGSDRPEAVALGGPAEPRRRFEPKVTDFGLAKKMDGEQARTQSGVLMGTPSYMSPEQALGKKAVGPPADVYALGAILYELLTGRPPFKAETGWDTVRQVTVEEPVPPGRLNSKVPRDLETICLKCLHKDTRKRYDSALALAEDLARFQAGQPIVARRVGRLERTAKWVRRNPALAAFVVAVVLLVVGGSAAGLWYQAERERQAAEQDERERKEAAEQRWREQLQARRLERLERDVAVALKEALTLMKRALTLTDQPQQWENTLTAARKAVQVAESMLAREGKSCPKALVKRVQEVRARLEDSEKDQQLVARFEEIRLEMAQGDLKTGWYKEDPFPKIRSALGRYGLPVGGLAVEQAVARVQHRPEPIRKHLLAVLFYGLGMRGQKKEKEKAWLAAVVRGADHDPWRRKILAALARHDVPAIKRLVKKVPVSRQPPALLVSLASFIPPEGEDSRLELLQRTQEAYPGDFWANFNLASAFANSATPQWKEAVRFLTAALALRPTSTIVYNNLGIALAHQQDLKGAIAAFHKALAINPRDTWQYVNLGFALDQQKKPKAAIAAFHKAIKIDPKFARAYRALGQTLAGQMDLKGAVAAYRKAIALKPQDADAHLFLGDSLLGQKKPKGAVTAYRKAIALNPRYAAAHKHLGFALCHLQDWKGAIAAYRKAVAIDPKLADAHVSLGILLTAQGRFAQALVSLQEGAKLLPPSDPRRPELLQRIRPCQRWADLERKLPEVLNGRQQPRSNAECLEYAAICPPKRLYVAACRFYQQAFAADSKLAEGDPKVGNLYNAATAAALAAAGRGRGAAQLNDKDRSRWRKQAVAWLRAELALWARELAKKTPEAVSTVRQELLKWQKNPNLAGIRDAAALAKLPPEEQAACRKLWSDVAALLQKAAAKP
jgi:serine/threonine-protein kinase